MTRPLVALIGWILSLMPSGPVTAQNRTTSQSAFSDLLRLYGCVHIVRLLAVDAQSSSHSGVIFGREVARVPDGTGTIDFINQESLRCGRVTIPASTTPSSRHAIEDLEAVAHALARAAIYERLTPQTARARLTAALLRLLDNDLPKVSELATADVLTTALGPQAGVLLREHEAWVRKATTFR